MLNILGQGNHHSLIAEGWIQGKPCGVTFKTGTSVTIARPDVVAGKHEKRSGRTFVLLTASVEQRPHRVDSGTRALKIWVFVSEITDLFILGLDVLRVYGAFVDIGRNLLRPGQ